MGKRIGAGVFLTLIKLQIQHIRKTEETRKMMLVKSKFRQNLWIQGSGKKSYVLIHL